MRDILYPVAIKILENPNYMWMPIVFFTVMVGIPLAIEYKKYKKETAEENICNKSIIVLSMDYLKEAGLEERCFKDAMIIVEAITEHMPTELKRHVIMSASKRKDNGKTEICTQSVFKQVIEYHESQSTGASSYFMVPHRYRDTYIKITDLIEK